MSRARTGSALAALLLAGLLLPVPPVRPPALRAPSDTVTDEYGRPVDAGPVSSDRVVSLVPSATDLIVAMGASDRLAGRTRYDSAPAVVDLPNVGEPLTPSLERVVGVEPALVIAWARLRGRSHGVRLESLDDVSVYYARTSSLDAMGRLLADLGRLLGRPGAADSLRRVLDCQLRAVERAVEGRAPVPTAHLIWPDPPVAAGPDSYLDSLIRVAGGRNVFSEAESAWPRVSLEALVAEDPAALVLGGTTTDSAGWSALSGRPGWSSLAAAESGRVFEVRSDLFHRPGPQVGRAAAILARRLHPGAPVPDPSVCVPPPRGT